MTYHLRSCGEFLATGSITAYLLYKQLSALRIHTLH